MSTQQRKQDDAEISYTTHIGSITGQVHTGSGDIFVEQFSVNSPIANKEDFLALLQQVKTSLADARQKGVAEDAVDDALTECEAAEREVKKEAPKIDRILPRMEKAKAILVASAGVAAAATTAAAAIGSLIPLFEKAIEVVRQIF